MLAPLRCLDIGKQRVCRFWPIELPYVHRYPTGRAKQVHVPLHQAPIAAEMVYLRRKRIGNRYGRTCPPQRRIIALGQFVMQDQEVVDALIFRDDDPVLFLRHQRIEIAIREQGEQFGNTSLHEMNICRFQRLHETTGKADRHDIAVPELRPPSGDTAQEAWIGQSLSIQIGHQGRACFNVGDMCAGIDVAVAGSMLRRDAPLPTRRPRNRAGMGRKSIAPRRAWHSDGAVARQPVRP